MLPTSLPLRRLVLSSTRPSTSPSSSFLPSRHFHARRLSLRPSFGRFNNLFKLSSRCFSSYYGHISDVKMAPQLEPFFKESVNWNFCWRNAEADPVNIGWIIRPKPSLSVRYFPCIAFDDSSVANQVVGLRKAVAIPSISAQDECRSEVVRVSSIVTLSSAELFAYVFMTGT